MTLPTYPGDIPYEPLRESVSYEADYPRPLVTEMEDGAQRSRQRGLTVWTPMSFSVLMTVTEYTALEAFIASIGNASAPFMMPVWRPGDTFPSKEVRIQEGIAVPKKFGLDDLQVDFKIRVKNWRR